MTFRAMMQSSTVRANELFARLAETSDGAVKTREKLFGELKTELELFAGLEEQHLFPILRKNPETRELVADAIRDNKDLRAALAEVETLPKNDETFAERIADLQKMFRQHARDEKKELLPAVQRALSEEQVQQVAEKIEAGRAEAEQAKLDEAEERRTVARREREQADMQARQSDAAERQREAVENQVRDTAGRIAGAAVAPLEATAEMASRVTRLAANAPNSVAMAERLAPGRSSAAQMSSLLFWPWLGMMQGMQPGRDMALGMQPGRDVAARTPASGEEVVQLGEEVLDVSKRTINNGTARIRRYVVETEVERPVSLQSEKVVVERRRPVTDKVTGEILTELTVEVTETAEIPIVGKRTRLREEVVVRTERTQRVEMVRATLRRDEVEIHQPGRSRTPQQRTLAAAERG